MFRKVITSHKILLQSYVNLNGISKAIVLHTETYDVAVQVLTHASLLICGPITVEYLHKQGPYHEVKTK